MSNIKNATTLVPEIPDKRSYWFIRTDSGIHFDDYYKYNFIGIGWNYLTPRELQNLDTESVKKIIAKREDLDMSISKSKGLVTSIYNKLIRFQNLKKGDLILIPSYGASSFAFGILDDDKIYTESEKIGTCDYIKRRKVKWIKTTTIDSLDPIFYKIKMSRHAISDIDKYAKFIDRETESLYTKHGYAHFIINVRKEDDINLQKLISFIDAVKKLVNDANEYFKYEENITELAIRLNLQSPGIIELISKQGGALIVAGALIATLASCNSQANTIQNDTLKTELKKSIDNDKFVDVQEDSLKDIAKLMSELEINIEKVNGIGN